MKAIDAPHLQTTCNASPLYWQEVLKKNEYGLPTESIRVPFYYLPQQQQFIIVFDLFSYSMQGEVQAQMVMADTSEDLQKIYHDAIKLGPDYFIKRNATTQLQKPAK